MARTLLPVFEKFKVPFVYVEEPEDDFSFIRMSYERSMYERFRDIVNSVEGARDYLKTYKKVDGQFPFYDGLGPTLINIFCTLGQDYRADYITGIDAAQRYHIALFRLGWKDFVIQTKTEYAKEDYRATQIPKEHLWPYSHAVIHKKALWGCYGSDAKWVEETDGAIQDAVQGVKMKYALDMPDEQIHLMLAERMVEYDLEINEEP